MTDTTNAAEIMTIIFEIVAGLVLTGLVPWAYKVTKQLSSIETTLREREKQEVRLDEHDARIGKAEIAIARLQSGGVQ